jgi:3-dehydroquinate synthase
MSNGPQRLSLRHPGGTTTVFVGRGVVEASRPSFTKWLTDRLVFLVSSPRVLELHGDAIQELLAPAETVVTLTAPEGEEAKSLEVAGRLWAEMLESGGKRDSRLVAFGGGSIGDLGGFLAGCFLRGIEYLQLPTTLLAQVDASLGGKTAVDHGATKNSIGLFHHPALVLSEIAFLSTLPKGELRAALAEVVKMALLLDPLLLEWVERDLDKLLAGDPAALEPVVVASAKAKMRVVERDPEEGDQRRLLNFGHTLGHALEVALGYGDLRHGEAVAYGMLFALRLAERRGLEKPVAERLRRLLARFDLPALPPVDPDELMEIMGRDKKAKRGGLVWVLPVAAGEGRMVPDIEPEEVRRELEDFLRDPLPTAS